MAITNCMISNLPVNEVRCWIGEICFAMTLVAMMLVIIAASSKAISRPDNLPHGPLYSGHLVSTLAHMGVLQGWGYPLPCRPNSHGCPGYGGRCVSSFTDRIWWRCAASDGPLEPRYAQCLTGGNRNQRDPLMPCRSAGNADSRPASMTLKKSFALGAGMGAWRWALCTG